MSRVASVASSAPPREQATRAREVVALVHAKPIGAGGLGRLAEDALRSLASTGADVHAFGPATPSPTRDALPGITWHEAPPAMPRAFVRWSWLRWRMGQVALVDSVQLGRWAAREVARLHPDRVYAFAEVARETLEWTRRAGVPSVLDNPTGDVRHFHDAAQRETRRWAGEPFRGHPNAMMVRRCAREYALADVVRVASTFSRASMLERGEAADHVAVVRYPVDVRRFVPPPEPRPATGPLRVCYVAAIALAKGYQYLLEAARAVGAERVHLELVGGTESRGGRRVLERLEDGLDVRRGPVPNLVEAYHRAEVFVLPSLHDGWGFVVAEAMACGLPVIVTDTSGARDLVEPGRTGWIVPAADADAIAAALREALGDRARLAVMGAAAREAVIARGREWDGALARWWKEEAPARRAR